MSYFLVWWGSKVSGRMESFLSIGEEWHMNRVWES